MKAILQNKYIQNLIEFIFPHLCLGCGAYSENEKVVCDACEKNIELIQLPYCLRCFSSISEDIRCFTCKDDTLPLLSYADYTGPMREIIIQYKFKGITSPSQIFAERIYKMYSELLHETDADFLVPIPLHRSREAERGYNQASIFATEISKHLNVPLNEDIITRIKKRKHQAKLAIADREKNIQSVFHVEEITEDEINCIVVDDVVTTGSTVVEATKVLEESGYKVVAVVSIAHAF